MTKTPFTVYKSRSCENTYLCTGCLDAHFGSKMAAGKWDEHALDECSLCGFVNEGARDEYHEWCLMMENEEQRLQWEEQQIENGELL